MANSNFRMIAREEERPGNTSFAPTRGAEKSRPQQFAWNAGTTARTQVAAVMQEASGIATVKACRKLALCEYSTPCMQYRKFTRMHP